MSTETKAEAFERIVGPRIEKALHAIDLLYNCAHPRSYDYTRERALFIITQLSAGVDALAPPNTRRRITW